MSHEIVLELIVNPYLMDSNGDFDDAFTNCKEDTDQVHENFHNAYPNRTIVSIEFLEFDSGNAHEAVGYFLVIYEGNPIIESEGPQIHNKTYALPCVDQSDTVRNMALDRAITITQKEIKDCQVIQAFFERWMGMDAIIRVTYKK